MCKKSPDFSFRLSVIAFAMTQLFAVSALAADPGQDRTAELEKKLEQSLQQIQALSARITQLENAAKTTSPGQANPTANVTPTAVQEKLSAQEQRLEKLEKSVEQVASSAADQSSNDSNILGVPVHGFIALGYGHLPNPPNLPNTVNSKSGFQMANVDFYFAPNFGDQLKAIMELNLEYTDQGVLTYDLERFEIGYTFNDLVNIWAGRFHTPYGEWNTAFHHGHFIQTSIDRPRFVAFEDQGGVMPSHTIGVMESGTARVNGGDRVSYDFFVGNGSRIIPASDGNTLGIALGNQLEFNPVGDDNGNTAYGGRVSYQFNNTFTLGAHGLSEVVDTYDGNNVRLNSTKLNMLGAFYLLEWNDWESIGEYYRFKNDDKFGANGTNGTHNSWAAFAQVSYTFGNIWTPYARIEKAELDQTDNYFASLASGRTYTRQVLGLRWDFNKAAALKFETDRTHELEIAAPDEKYNRTRVQLDVKF